MRPPTIEQLVFQAQNGNQAAANTVAARFEWVCRGIASDFFMYGGDPDDVIGEARVGLVKAIRDFRAGRNAKFPHFARVCIRRQILTGVVVENRKKSLIHHQAASLSAVVDGTDSVTLDETLPSSQPEPLDEVRGRAQLRLVLDGEGLSFLEHQSVLAIGEGYTHQEIADELGVHTKAVDNALSRGRRKLGEVLDDAA